MHIKILTHDRIIYDGEADEIYSKSTSGEFGILKDHLPFMCALDTGVTKIVKGNDVKFFTTIGGTFQFKENEALILTQCAECGDEIDVARADDAKKRAEARIAEHLASLDAKRADAALARAKARLKAAMEK